MVKKIRIQKGKETEIQKERLCSFQKAFDNSEILKRCKGSSFLRILVLHRPESFYSLKGKRGRYERTSKRCHARLVAQGVRETPQLPLALSLRRAWLDVRRATRKREAKKKRGAADPFADCDTCYACCSPECQHHLLKAYVRDGKVVKVEGGGQ